MNLNTFARLFVSSAGSSYRELLTSIYCPPVVLAFANASSSRCSRSDVTTRSDERSFSTRSSATRDSTTFINCRIPRRQSIAAASLTLSRRMNSELEFSRVYTLSKTLTMPRTFDEQPQNPFNRLAEDALSTRESANTGFVFNALWGVARLARKGQRQEGQKETPLGSPKSSATLKWRRF